MPRTIHFVNSEVVYEMLKHSNLGDIARFSQVSREMRRLAQSYVNAKLRRILASQSLDVEFIMPLLRKRKSVIGGSITLMLLNPWTFDSADVDFYVPRKEGAAFIKDLKAKYSLDIVFCSRDHPYLHVPGAYAAFMLKNDSCIFNVVISWFDNPLLPITYFHSSALFNYISGSEVYVAYPTLTFLFRNVINSCVFRLGPTERSIDNQAACLAKYFHRGYDYATELYGWPEYEDHVCRRHSQCPKTVRTFRDGGGRRFLLHNITSDTIETVPRIDATRELAWNLFD